MSDEWVRWLLGGCSVVIITVIGWGVASMLSAIRSKANSKDSDERFRIVIENLDRHIEQDRDVHREDKELFRDIGRKLDETNRHLSMTNATLANLSGRYDGGRGRAEG